MLEFAMCAYLFFSDCIETNSVIKESITLAKSKVKTKALPKIIQSISILLFC